jgi:cytochrome c oxidase subunit 3
MTAIQDSASTHDDALHGHHEHPEWLAHHFDDAEQQYDAGKFGMWMFLVTEVLFFSGMFCAYALLRNRNPEVFEYCSQFLNEKLGAINTGVLLFSSLTMAWAVRSAQLREYRLLIVMLGATLGCAAMFLGVKAVEYSHKWELGLLPGKFYVAQLGGHSLEHQGYLEYLCIVPLILTVSFFVYWIYSLVTKSSFHQQVAGPLFVAGLCFFGGVGLGQMLEAQEAAAHESHAGHEHAGHAHTEHTDHAHGSESATEATASLAGTASISETGLGPSEDVKVMKEALTTPNVDVNQKGMAGLFFSIYYCMTGIHAIHIIGGMVVITWLITKAARREFHEKYFGPVDNVGLYWHLVDFIWIYLFPLLYLIT